MTKPLELRLKSWEAKRLQGAPVEGGQLGLRDRLLAKLQAEDPDHHIYLISFSDAEAGELLRHMAYGKGVGGWQQRLREAFLPAILRAIGARL